MKTIYFKILMFATLLVAMGCDRGGVTDVFLSNEDTPIEVIGMSPETGYAGENVTITGAGFGGYASLLKVYIGEYECTQFTASATRIVAKVPEGATSGKVSLRIVDRLWETNLNFTVKEAPSLTPVKSDGYLNGVVTFDCKGMPEDADNLTVFFGRTRGEIVAGSYHVDANGDGTMEVKVPSRLSIGMVDMSVSLYGVKVYDGEYKILETPFFNTGNTLAVAGSTITLTGEGFGPFAGTDKMRINFGGTLVAPASITETKVTVVVPGSFTGGEISAHIEGLPVIPAGVVSILNPGTDGDITAQVLLNSLQPFESSNGSSLDGWLYNDAFTGPSIDRAKETDGLILLQSGWSCPAKENAKMYQNVALPSGKYRFELTVKECGRNSGTFNAMFAVSQGKASLPDVKADGTPVKETLGWQSVTGTKIAYDGVASTQYTLDIEVKDGGDVCIGFVATMTGQCWAKLSSVKVKWLK